jgi:glyoxylase-like metal-dependent hydrolase (beta-lactamase superfamily II)
VAQLAENLWHLPGFPANAVNVYVIGDVLIDSALPFDRRRILKQLRDHQITAHALTHAHFDHYGSSRAICEALGVPFWCGAADVEAVEAGKMVGPRGMMLPAARSVHVDRALTEGDEVGGFQVLDTPGHSPGHVSYWRESDRALIVGDVFTNIDTLTGLPGLHEPKTFFTPDPARNRESMRKLAALEPALVCFGHGRPLRDPGKLSRFTDRLAA